MIRDLLDAAFLPAVFVFLVVLPFAFEALWRLFS